MQRFSGPGKAENSGIRGASSLRGDAIVTIRPERPDEYTFISDVHARAFGRENEARLVEMLRNSDEFIPGLSLVAVKEDKVVGHILFSPIRIGIAGNDNGRDGKAVSLSD